MNNSTARSSIFETGSNIKSGKNAGKGGLRIESKLECMKTEADDRLSKLSYYDLLKTLTQSETTVVTATEQPLKQEIPSILGKRHQEIPVVNERADEEIVSRVDFIELPKLEQPPQGQKKRDKKGETDEPREKATP
jgi:hypothetical protein